MSESREEVEERIVDTLIGWKQHADRLAGHTIAARRAIAEAQEVRIWEGKYQTFPEWLQQECGITRQWAYELINSTQAIALIEAAAEKSPALAPLVEPDNVEVLRAMPPRTVKKLQKVTPAKAAKVVLKAIKENPGKTPKPKAIEAQLAKLKKPAAQEPAAVSNHPVLIALDNEWIRIRQDLAVSNFTPKELFDRFRKAVAGVLQ